MNLNLRIITYLLFWCLCLNVGAQRIKELEGEYTCQVLNTETIEEAKKRALNLAILQAMADEFGTLMIQNTGGQVTNKNGKSDIDITSISESVVQGELINIVDEPVYNLTYPNNELWCKVEVKFRARKRVIKNAEIESKIYRKGPDDRSSNIGVESSEFLSGDQLIMSFQSSADGYLAIYLVEGDEVYCLLPYRQDDDGKFFVKQGEKHILFSRKEGHYSKDVNKDWIDEYSLTSDKDLNQNAIHVVFSPNEFSKALDRKGEDSDRDLPRTLSLKEFQEWIGKRRTRDVQLQHTFEQITVKRRE